MPAVTLDDIKQRLAGTTWPVTSNEYDGSLTDLIGQAIAEITHEVVRKRNQPEGWDWIATPSAERFYHATPFNRGMLLIDDATEVTAAKIYEGGSLQTTLVADQDFYVVPANSTPIQSLQRILDSWPWGSDYRIGVVQTFGRGTDYPSDICMAWITEVVRAYLSARAGENDAIGITPFAAVVTAKAFTQKTWQTISEDRKSVV